MLSLFGCGGTSSIPSEGVFGSKWGTEGTGAGQFDMPNGVAVAPDGSFYVLDFQNDRSQKFTSEGVFVNKWGTKGTGAGQFEGAGGRRGGARR